MAIFSLSESMAMMARIRFEPCYILIMLVMMYTVQYIFFEVWELGEILNDR